MRFVFVLSSLFVVACAPAVQINGVVGVVPPQCTPTSTPHAQGLLDIGTDQNNANAYTTALSVGAPEKDITYDKVEMFFTTDEDRGSQLQLGQVDGTPVNANNARSITIGATSASDAVVATIVTSSDATLLQQEPFVNASITASGKAHVIANVTLHGKTAGGGDVASQLFPVPLDLCAGCLTSSPLTCGTDASGNAIAPVANADACFVGDDVPAFVCP